MMDIWLIILIILGALEGALRQIPTTKSRGIVSWLLRILDYFIPDRAEGGKVFKHECKKEDKK